MKTMWILLVMAGLSVNAMAHNLLKPLPLEKGHIENGYCSPQLDDDCYLNNQPVPKAKLGDYLPTVSVEVIEQSGGYCEYPICYGHDDKPAGVRDK